MTTPEEMLETYRLAWEADREQQDTGFRLFDPKQAARKALEAVIEKHVGPMLEKAFVAGWNVTHSNGLGSDESSTKYAARVIAQLKGPTP